MDLDVRVKLQVYRTVAEDGTIPSRAAVARALACGEDEVRGAFERLRARRLLFLAPETGEIVMAPPFAASPTPFRVTAGERAWFANCVWDALGVAAALHREVTVSASCGCCGDPMVFEVRRGPPPPQTGVAHFAVPAAHWWDDLVYT